MMTMTIMTILTHCAWLQGKKKPGSNHANDDFDIKMNLYFTTESHGTLKLFTWFIAVKTITKLNLERGDK